MIEKVEKLSFIINLGVSSRTKIRPIQTMETVAIHRGALARTLAVNFAFMCYCIALVLPGVSLLDLEIRIQESFAVTSRLISINFIGYIFGSVLVTIFEKYTNTYVVLSVFSILSGSLTMASPWFYSFIKMAVCQFALGIAHSVIELECNICLFKIWGEKVSNYIQILQVNYGLGGFLGPLIVRPFLLPIPQDIGENWDLYRAAYSPDDVHIQWPFLYVGIAGILSGLPFIFFIQTEKSKLCESSFETKHEARPPPSPLKMLVAVTWVALICHMSFAIETIVHSFGQAYGVKSVAKMEKKDAALVTTVFWSGYSAAQIVFVIASGFIGKNFLVSTCIGCLSISNLLCLLGSNKICLFLSSCLLGIGSSPLFSVAFASLEKYFHISGRQASAILSFGTIGCALHPPIVGYFMDANPDLYIYYLVSLSTVLIFIKISLPFICRILFTQTLTIEQPASAKKHRKSSFAMHQRRGTLASIGFRKFSTN